MVSKRHAAGVMQQVHHLGARVEGPGPGAGDKKQKPSGSFTSKPIMRKANSCIDQLATGSTEMTAQQVLDELNADPSLVGHVADLGYVSSRVERAREKAAEAADRARLAALSKDAKQEHIYNKYFVYLAKRRFESMEPREVSALYSAFMRAADPTVSDDARSPAFDPKASKQRLNDAVRALRQQNKDRAAAPAGDDDQVDKGPIQ